MLIYENIGIFLRGMFWNFIFSVPVIYALQYMFLQYFGRMQIKFPWEVYMLSFAITIITLVIITWHAYRRKDENLLEIMRKENI